MMQPIEEIEKHYETPDPWGYQKNPEDIKRSNYIVKLAQVLCKNNLFLRFSQLLDIGAGEGWITRRMPALNKFAYEISKNAKSRLPGNVIAISDEDLEKMPIHKFDLVLATGVLYKHYDYKKFVCLINKHSKKIIITCNIKEWEVPEVKDIQAKQIFEAEFPYREYTQKLRIFQR